MTVVVKALAGTAVQHRRFAKRVGQAAKRAGGSLTRIFDGYLFVAKGDRRHVVVYVLDPPALWVICQYKAFGTDRGWPPRFGVRHFDRGQLSPLPIDAELDPPAVAAAPAPPTPLAIVREDALNFVSHGRAQFGGDPLSYFFFHGQSDWRGDFVSTTSYLSDMASTSPNPARNVCIHSIANSFRVNAFQTDEAQPDVLGRYDAALEFVWTEAGFRILLGSSRFRFFPVAANWPSRALICTAPRRLTESDLEFDELVMASTYLLQGPYSSNPELDKSDEYEHGFLVGSWRALRVLEGSYTVRNLQTRWCVAIRMGLNDNWSLRPVSDPEVPGGYYRHGVTDLGIADSDTEVIALVSMAVRADEGLATATDTYGTQLYRFDRADGSYTMTTLHAASFLASDAATTTKALQFALNRLAYAYVDTAGIEHKTEALAVVAFTSTASVDAASIELVLYATSGDTLPTGLGEAGYAPFWPKLRDAYSVWGHTENLGYALAPQQMIVQDIGAGLIGVIAATKAAVSGSADIAWHLVVLEAETLDFLEDRGTIDTLPSNAGVTMSLSVVVPETANSPAVLVASVASYQTAARQEHRLSRDGGRTWHTLFTGVAGPIAYLGNQLHPVEISRGL